MTPEDIQHKLRRIAYEIWEDNYDESEIILAGIGRHSRGYIVAEKLCVILEEIADFKIQLTHINLSKRKPTTAPVELGIEPASVDGKTIIIVDDVANTGKTLLYALKPLMDYSPKKIRMAILVDRKHKKYPICADYVGLSLSTTMQEHISVVLDDVEKVGAYLN